LNDATRFFDRLTANLPFRATQHDVGMLVKQPTARRALCWAVLLSREAYGTGTVTARAIGTRRMA